MGSFVKIGAVLISGPMAPLGGTMAAPDRPWWVEGAAWSQKVRKEILVTDPKAGAPPARRFRAIYDLLLGGGSDDPPYPHEGLRRYSIR